MSTQALILAQLARDAEADAPERKREAIAQEAEVLDALFREDLNQTSTGRMLRGYLSRNVRVITAFDALLEAIAEAQLEEWARDADADAAADKWESQQ